MAPAGAATVATAPEKRREKRLHIAVPVKVFPDIASIESQNCCTYEISATGARLVTPPGSRRWTNHLGASQNRPPAIKSHGSAGRHSLEGQSALRAWTRQRYLGTGNQARIMRSNVRSILHFLF